MRIRLLRIRFDKIDDFIRVYDRTRYLVLFRSEKCKSIYNKIRYLIGVKNGGISKSEPINKVKNIIWTKTSRTLSNFSNCKLTTNSNLNEKSGKL